MKLIQIVNISNIVNDTIRNEEGCKLYSILNCYLLKGDEVHLSLKDSDPMSSSFMNSSFGELIEKWGLETFKKKIKIRDFKNTHVAIIKDYISRFSDLVT